MDYSLVWRLRLTRRRVNCERSARTGPRRYITTTLSFTSNIVPFLSAFPSTFPPAFYPSVCIATSYLTQTLSSSVVPKSPRLPSPRRRANRRLTSTSLIFMGRPGLVLVCASQCGGMCTLQSVATWLLLSHTLYASFHCPLLFSVYALC